MPVREKSKVIEKTLTSMESVHINGNMELISIETLTAHGDHYARLISNVGRNIVVLTHFRKNNPAPYVHYIRSSKSP